MSRPVKVILVVVAIPVLVLGGAVVSGGYLAVTGQLVPAEDPVDNSVEEPIEESTTSVPVEESSAVRPSNLPANLDAESAKEYLEAERLLWVEDDEIRGDAKGFFNLPLEDAVALHRALRKGQKKYEGLRVLFFAWLCHLEPETRRAFADEAGIVYRPAGQHGRSYMGELTRLYFFQAADSNSIYAKAVRLYCEVTESDAVIQSLRDFGVIQEDPSVGQWHLRVDQKMQEFDAETLLAIREAIDLNFNLGDRKYLRAELANLAESKR